MKRILLGGLAGGLAYFIFLSISWTVLPFHTMAFNSLDDTQPIVDALQQQGMSSGLYTLPSVSEMQADPEDFTRRHTQGPIVPFLVYYEEGRAPMAPGTFLIGILYALLEGLIVAGLLFLALDRLGGYGKRVLFVLGIGLFSALTGPLTLGNWMYFPAGYVWAEVFDHVLGWTVAGLVIAAIVKPAPTPPTPVA